MKEKTTTNARPSLRLLSSVQFNDVFLKNLSLTAAILESPVGSASLAFVGAVNILLVWYQKCGFSARMASTVNCATSSAVCSHCAAIGPVKMARNLFCMAALRLSDFSSTASSLMTS